MNALLPNTFLKLLALCISVLLLGYLAFVSLVYGVVDTSWQTVIDAYTNFQQTNEHIVIKEVRVPRVLNAIAVGASLGIAGALLQSLTRNPVADVELFGLNAGAAFFIVVAVTFFSISSLTQFSWIAFTGAAVAGFIVYILGSFGRDGLTPVKLTLAGAAITALSSSARHGLLVLNDKALDI